MATIGAALLGLLLVVCCATTIAHNQKQWIVGDNKGFTFDVSGWENGKRVQSSDVLGKNTCEDQLEEGDYNSCMVTGPSRTYTSGNDHIKLAGSGKAFFICSCLAHYEQGMKITIIVEWINMIPSNKS
ncbi:hypothetical protein ACQ4PT_064517 [Festuca glaucescens]